MFATAVRIERDLGVPSVSFNSLTGHRSCAPEDCGGRTTILPQGPAPVVGRLSGGWYLSPSGDWDSGNATFAVSRGSPGAPTGVRLEPVVFWPAGSASDLGGRVPGCCYGSLLVLQSLFHVEC